MMKIGIFGGAFNPIHNGHISLCRQCKELLCLDEIILIPTHISPHKNTTVTVDFKHRFNMTKLAVSGIDGFSVSDIEYKRGGISYTYDTINSMKSDIPDAEFYLIIGSDMLEIFHKWYRFNDIINMVNLVVGARNKDEYEKLISIKNEFFCDTNRIKIVEINVVEMSSTNIRKYLQNEIDISNQINRDVVGYINVNGLYRSI